MYRLNSIVLIVLFTIVAGCSKVEEENRIDTIQETRI
ncbi:hypothetical protein HNP81_003819 [Peribacillus huizhouensis]|uniref:Uncharacterized protein n=1 Tax=Peribacillus huizhouensis TaxID=1501239 RepID=A0ABR6CTZ8_9BACI|nr:hypothetical protein [Peribacillus huizhouensis]